MAFPSPDPYAASKVPSGSSGRRCALEIIGDRQLGPRAVSTLALDFDIVVHRRNSDRIGAVIVTATSNTYRAHLERVRRHTDAPTLLILDGGEVADRVGALESGADAIVAAPCDPCELLAQLRALMRRAGAVAPALLAVDDLRLDVKQMIVHRGERRIELSSIEFGVLATLARHDGSPVSVDEIARAVWGRARSKNTVHTFIYLLRAKLNGPGERPLIGTVHRQGYILRPPPVIEAILETSAEPKISATA